MATFDLDPLFLKGLRLLHSKAKDSADQLQQLLEDVLNQKQSSSGPINLLPRNLHITKQDIDTKSTSSKKNSPKHSNESSSHSSKSSISDEPKKRDTEKRQFERLKQELSELCYEAKRAKPMLAESPHSSSLSSSPSPQPVLKTEDYALAGLVSLTSKSDVVDASSIIGATNAGGSADAEDFAVEMGLACIICRQLDVSPRNRMIECQECHSLYHQDCHRPPVTDNEVNDPRHVWYCTRCTKNMRKISKSQKGSKNVTSSPVNSREPFSKLLKVPDNPVPPPPSLLPFKRSEIKTSPVPQGSGSLVHNSNVIAPTNKPTGLASLAANFSSRSATASSSTSVSSSSSSSSKSIFGKSSLSSLSSKSHFPPAVPSAKPAKPFAGMSGLASLASAAAVVAKSSSNASRSSGSGSSASSAATAAGNGSGGGNNGGGKSSSSSLMSAADKRLQIMKKKAAAKMQEKRRLSSK